MHMYVCMCVYVDVCVVWCGVYVCEYIIGGASIGAMRELIMVIYLLNKVINYSCTHPHMHTHIVFYELIPEIWIDC